MLGVDNLSEPQKQCVRDILNKRVGCITPDCGFGKTVVGLTAFNEILKRHPDSKALFVAPPKGAKETWVGEHENWNHLKNLKVVPLLGSPKDRLKKLQQNDGNVYIITYGTLDWLRKVNDIIKFNYVFADEASCLKGSSSKFRKYLMAATPFSKWRILATATPKSREEDDYWGLCRFLDDGESLGKTITEFRGRYMTPITLPNTNAIFYKMRKDMIPELESKIHHLFWNYELSDGATIPVKEIIANTSLTDESKQLYDRLEEEQCINSLLEYSDYATDEDDGQLNALQISAKLNQLSSGFMYVDDNLRIDLDDLRKAESAVRLMNSTKKRVAVEIFDDRIRAMDRLDRAVRKRHGDVNIVICYHFTHELQQLLGLFPNALVDTEDDLITKWESGEYKHLLLQYSRSSMSLNLQHGGHIMIMYSSTFKWVDDYQIVRRLARQGQKASCVYVYRLMLDGTVDDVKAKKLNERFIGHKRFQSAILKRLQNGKAN